MKNPSPKRTTLFLDSVRGCVFSINKYKVDFDAKSNLHRQKALPDIRQADITMSSHRLLRLYDNKSAASRQPA